jgi:hypothetical protein
MCRTKLVRLAAIGLAVAALAPRAVFAQAVISGVVKDASGAVLPGVTVEAASPVLIEKVKSAVTNDTGQYRIVDLRPGSYDVTFTLTGFSSVKREGVELAGTSTATINADLKVGSVEETITVTGAAPLVDVQGTETERSISHELLDSVPTSRTIHAVATLIPGLSVQGGSGNPNVADVGGSALGITPQASIHGGAPNDQRLLMEGLPLQAAAGNNTDFQVNMGSIQELTIDTAGGSAEEFSGGVRLNIIPREGGNLFHGSLFVDGAGPALQTSNYTDRLAAAGFPKPNPLKPLLKTYNINPAVGGPLKKDKLWFFAAVNRSRNTTVIPVYPNLNVGNPAAWTYVANPSGEYSNIDILFYGENGRLTWQATPKNKFAFYHDTQVRCSCPQGSAAQAPESQPSRYLPVARFTSLSYTAPISNRLVFDASALYRYDGVRTSGAMNISPSIISVVDNGLDLTYRNYGSEANENVNRNYNVRGSISLVTGAHALKAGFQTERTKNQSYQNMNDSETRYRFTSGVPNQITLFADPRSFEIRGRDIDLFIQDRWTVKRFTFTGGLRYDDYATSFPDQSLGPVPLAPNRNVSFPAADGARIRDITPRMGVAYDVFGNGRTAVRASMNKYLTAMVTGSSGVEYNFGYRLSPANLVAASTTRSWTDSNKNFIPDCVLSQITANGECGAMANSSFGLPVVSNTYDPALLDSWNKRSSNWEFTAGLQQQVLDRMALEVLYVRRTYANQIVTDNLALAASDFTKFSITAPADSRLPGGGGFTVGGLYDVNPAKFGQTNNFTTAESNYGDMMRRWQGIDVIANVRAMRGLTFQGGVASGSYAQDVCDLKAAVPEATKSLSLPFYSNGPTDPYCRFTAPWITQIKGLGSYAVPKVGAQVSLALQSMPGPPVVATYNATNAVVQPSLGRVLSGSVANVPVNLIEPGTLYGERMNLVDLRVSKLLRFGGRKVSLDMDVFNLFNVDTVLLQNNAYAPNTSTWNTPQTIVAGRLIKFGGQFEF